ncbi:hypothetical protein RBSWK_05300 [Rhodopirellula baltica SWK14]|uniref:Uncharacterized protein n=1 Tax=Rhodopirellula baltica SWK14 TaxID=993516 RepID=L7C982_RHOBT|nr:hypothetical protein RBSWK_05300 [Rhodopirellula baltica SWK14]
MNDWSLGRETIGFEFLRAGSGRLIEAGSCKGSLHSRGGFFCVG